MQLPYRIEPKDKIQEAFNESLLLNKGAMYVAFFDGNSIKKINDTYGHVTGDHVIFHIAKTLVDNLRHRDRIVRFGGDEFVVFLNNFDNEAIRPFIERIQQKVRSNPEICQKVGSVSISAGVVKYDPNTHKTLESVLHDADMLMYAAKVSAPLYLKISGDRVDAKKAAEKRKTDNLSKRKRAMFTWVATLLQAEHPDYLPELIVESCRDIWRANGNKVVYSAALNELLNLVNTVYKSKASRPRTAKIIKNTDIATKQEIEEIRKHLRVFLGGKSANGR
jgi:diguanylate cyclase (GGDEF)-like protein